MVYRLRSGKIAFWALAVSIAVHLLFLTIFAVIKISHSKARSPGQSMPTANVKTIKKLIGASLVIPKPKIKELPKKLFTAKPPQNLPTNRIFESLRPKLHRSAPLAEHGSSASVLPRTGRQISHKAVEFFGSRTYERKICYVVDCSGSMKGIFSRVRKELEQSITALQPDQYFYIIFFGSGRFFESGKGQLLRATSKAKSATFKFIDSIQPAGRTNAAAALERAMQIHDSSHQSPAVVYFLTDGFELAIQDTSKFSQKIEKLLKESAPETKINTIGFWPQSNDRIMLESIAKQSGGEFVCVEDQ